MKTIFNKMLPSINLLILWRCSTKNDSSVKIFLELLTKDENISKIFWLSDVNWFYLNIQPKFKLITDKKEDRVSCQKSIWVYKIQGGPKMNYNGSAPPDINAAQQVNISSRIFMYFILWKIFIFVSSSLHVLLSEI